MIRTATIARSGRIAALAAVLTGLVLTFSGCGGGAASALNGDYYSTEDSFGGQLAIDGRTVAFYRFECNPDRPERGDHDATLKTEPIGEGKITDDGSQVLWDSNKQIINNRKVEGLMPVTLSNAGSQKIVDIDGTLFVSMTKDEALADYGQRRC